MEEKPSANNSKNDKEDKEDKETSSLIRKYVHNIRNLKAFNAETLRNINLLSYKDRMEILSTYNEMIEFF